MEPRGGSSRAGAEARINVQKQTKWIRGVNNTGTVVTSGKGERWGGGLGTRGASEVLGVPYRFTWATDISKCGQSLP